MAHKTSKTTSQFDLDRLVNRWGPAAVALTALLLKWPLLRLPGIGRDEAVYTYWAVIRPEPFYAPLLQITLRFFHLLGMSGLAAVRAPSLAAGIAVIFLFDRFLRLADTGARQRLFALTVLAFTPWQIYTGAILHPDNFFFAALLAAVWQFAKRHDGVAALLAGMTALAKPIGLLLLPVFASLFFYEHRRRLRKAVWLTAVMLAAASPVLLHIDAALLRAMAEFGRLSGESSIWFRLASGLLPIVLLGGAVLPILAVRGWKQGFALLRHPDDRLSRLILSLAAALLLFFGAAALLHGQIKGNWLLPALALLWPRTLPRTRPLAVLLALQLLMAAALPWAMSHPKQVAALEKRFAVLDDWYNCQAGIRDRRLSVVHSWEERIQEYASLRDFAGDLLQAAERAAGRPVQPAWIVADDYGLAAQMAFYWNNFQPRLVVPSDELLAGSLPAAGQKPAGDVVLLALHGPLQQLWPPLQNWRKIGSIAVPHSRSRLQLGLATGTAGHSRKTGETRLFLYEPKTNLRN